MQLCLVVLIFLVVTTFARYHEKTRFDRSVEEHEIRDIEDDHEKKQWSFIDDVTQFVAYKSRKENDCYIENIKQSYNASRKKRQARVLYASTVLTKLEAQRLAGDRIVNFCNGRNILLLQTTVRVPEWVVDPFFNEISIDKKDISPKHITDIVLTPLKARMKRQIQLEQQEKLNKHINQFRQRRQTNQFRGKFRGQTQSQYLNFGNGEKKEGKAEAEATQQSSRAVVSGSRGMGQAQSISLGGTGCEDCPGYPGTKELFDKTRAPTGTGRPGIPIGTGIVPGITYPGGIIPGSVHPGTVIPGADGTYPGGVRPGTVTPGTGETYPGDVIYPKTVIPGTDRTYPGGVRPGIVTPGTAETYPGGVRPGIVTPGTAETYPGSIRPGTIIPGTDGTYPGGIQPGPMIPRTGGTYPGHVHPGIIPGIDGTYPGGVRPGTIISGTDGTYPGGVHPGTIIPGAGSIYADRRPYPGSIQPGIMPGGVTGVETYPSIQPEIQPGQGPGIYPPPIVTTSVTTGATTVTGVGTYPTVPGTNLPSGPYAGISGTGASIGGTGIYPDGTQPNIPGTSIGAYPGTVVPGGTTQGIYPGGDQQTVVFRPQDVSPGLSPSKDQVPGTIMTTGSVSGTGQVITYPGGQPANGQVIYPTSGTIQPGKIPASVIGTQVIYPGTVPSTYPGSVQSIPFPGTLYPGQTVYPSGQIPTYTDGSRYPGIKTGTGDIQYPTGIIGITRGTEISGQYPGQLPGGISGQGSYPVYPGLTTTGTEEVSQDHMKTKPVSPTDDGLTESQASSSVQQVDSGTQASASAQGRYGTGTAQSQVTGTYSGSGAFSAQAGTSDVNKSAQTEISGGKEGATSNAQGIAGYGKSQTQVQLDSDSGATSTGAQSSGWNHGTNSQVQASSKGGMADAQANGEGNTSSQAQIGFQPYMKSNDETMENYATPFRGSGTASAQSGTHQGQSQSQLQGSFQYGITYTGAAQAGSGSGAASSRKPFNFTDTEFFKSFKPISSLNPMNVNAQTSLSESSNYNKQNENEQYHEQGLQSSSSSRQTVILTSKNNSDSDKMPIIEKPRTDDMSYDEYDNDYADEDDYPSVTDSKVTIKEKFSEIFPTPSPSHQKLDKTVQQQTRSQSQTIQITKGNQYNVHVKQDTNIPRTSDVLQPGQSVSGYTIPPGFRGRVMSISGTETVAQGDGKSQSQTVSLVPKDFNNTRSSSTEIRSLQTNHERYIGRYTTKNQGSPVNRNTPKHMRPTATIATKPNYYTVTNSVAGKMNGSNEPRKYEHRYYTKSSTCGYFTFSCNVVYGSNGRTKICKPKMPTYPDGTPIKC